MNRIFVCLPKNSFNHNNKDKKRVLYQGLPMDNLAIHCLKMINEIDDLQEK